MFVVITANAVIVLQHMPKLLVMAGKWNAFGENVLAENIARGVFPNNYLVGQTLLIRVGLMLTILTAVIPDYAVGKYSSVVTLSLIHVVGIAVGIAFILIGICWYCALALRTHRKHYKEADLWSKPLIWGPHLLTVWVFWLTLFFVVGFLAANFNQTTYDYSCESSRDTPQRDFCRSRPRVVNRQHLLPPLARAHSGPRALRAARQLQRGSVPQRYDVQSRRLFRFRGAGVQPVPRRHPLHQGKIVMLSRFACCPSR